MRINRLDHFVLTVASVEDTIDFYSRVLGMEPVTFAGGRRGLGFGQQKINLHPADNPYTPRAETALPGTGDFCLIAETPMPDIIAHLKSEGVEIMEGPVAKTGALGSITSVYFRDPDQNLVEISVYDEQQEPASHD